jgi:hypothetical protein
LLRSFAFQKGLHGSAWFRVNGKLPAYESWKAVLARRPAHASRGLQEGRLLRVHAMQDVHCLVSPHPCQDEGPHRT